jgi:hypothetical protein
VMAESSGCAVVRRFVPMPHTSRPGPLEALGVVRPGDVVVSINGAPVRFVKSFAEV